MRTTASIRAFAVLASVVLAGTSAARAQVVISEIMYDPVAGRGSEYVELHNAGDSSVSLRNWKLSDATAKTITTLPRSAAIGPGGYIVIAADSLLYRQFPWLGDSAGVRILGRSGLGLNSSGDEVVVRDASGRTVDSVAYRASWHRPDLDDAHGTSLERASATAPSTDARTWSSSSSRSGGTPCAPNSIALAPSVATAELAIEPGTVSPDADGIADVARISWRLPERTSRVMITLHDRQGRLVDRIVNNEPSGSHGEVIWDGFDPHGMPLPPEIYVVKLESYDPVGITLAVARAAIVVARR